MDLQCECESEHNGGVGSLSRERGHGEEPLQRSHHLALCPTHLQTVHHETLWDLTARPRTVTLLFQTQQTSHETALNPKTAKSIEAVLASTL